MAVNATSLLSLSVQPHLLSFIATKLLLLVPPCLLVLYLGQQQWRRRRRCSHADVFTFHSAALELLYVLGAACYYGGFYSGWLYVRSVGAALCSLSIPGEPSFHVLTCAERYLAVVHPVVYLGLRRSGGVRIRNASIGCVWLLCVGGVGATMASPSVSYVPYMCFFGPSLVAVAFCSLSVLCVLVRPGPGDVGRDGAQVDPSKRRALCTVATILGMQVLCFVGYLVSFGLISFRVLNNTDGTLVVICAYWLNLPSSSVLPVLYLQRAGKRLCHCR